MTVRRYGGYKFARTATSDKPVQDLQDWVQQAELCPLLNGKLVTLTMPASQQLAAIPHNLGLKFKGALLGGQSSALVSYRVLDATRTEAAGFDPSLYVAVFGSTTSGSNQTVLLFVFG